MWQNRGKCVNRYNRRLEVMHVNSPSSAGVHGSFHLSILKYENPFSGAIKLRPQGAALFQPHS